MVVEHLPHHPKVKGLISAATAGTSGENGKKRSFVNMTIEHCQLYFILQNISLKE
jgi:hypothetical protein